MIRGFPDTNVLVYAFSDDERRQRADLILRDGGVISIQTLNELSNVLRRKRRYSWADIGEAIAIVRYYFKTIVVLDEPLHDAARLIAARHQLSMYDALIVAAALQAKCDVLWSEDMHNGLVIDGRLRIINPFLVA